MSDETQKLFKDLVRELKPVFKEHGFRSKSQNFILETSECWVIISFQKSRWSSPEETSFYINVSATSKRWLGFKNAPPDKTPSYFECDWSWRAEQFGPDPNTCRWTLSNRQDFETTLAYVRALLVNHVLPATQTMTTEMQLTEQTGGFEFPQLKTRSIIYAANNQIQALKAAVGTLIEKYGSGAVSQGTMDHLLYLRTAFPEAMESAERT